MHILTSNQIFIDLVSGNCEVCEVLFRSSLVSVTRMCLIGCLAELLCFAAEEVEEIDQIDTIVEELEESESGVGKVKQFFGIVSEKEDAANQGIDRYSYILIRSIQSISV